jgi:glycosyltransferase involved in cell wall biosynthesis
MTAITVAICTWNRAALLRQTLAQMTELAVPPDTTWELLVVNNNCTDETEQVVRSFADQLPIRHLFEAQPGQSAARNLAVREATGEYLVWTDDDVLVDRDWLAAYRRAFDRWPDAAVFGGPIEPWFEGSPPEWLKQVFASVRHAYATLDLGPTPVPLAKPDRLPFGANMAFRMREQRGFVYDTSVGLKPNSQMRGEETALLWQLLDAGGHGWWVPDARVRHFIPQQRQTWAFLRRFYVGYGHYLAQAAPDHDSARLLGRPRWLWRSLLGHTVAYGARRLVGASPARWIGSFKEMHTSWGYLTRHP